jgi:hypothetical protein
MTVVSITARSQLCLNGDSSSSSAMGNHTSMAVNEKFESYFPTAVSMALFKRHISSLLTVSSFPRLYFTRWDV